MEIRTFTPKDFEQKGVNFVNSEFTIPSTLLMTLLASYKVPATTVALDKKYGLTTMHDILSKQVVEFDVVVSDEGKPLSILDHRNKFVVDTEYEELVTGISDKLGIQGDTKVSGATTETKFTLDVADSDNFLGDVFKRQLHITRLPQGGLAINTGTLRLACTNGMMVTEKGHSLLSRAGVPDEAAILNMISTILAFNLMTYMNKLWYRDGELVECSVADFYGMRNTLASITDRDTANYFYDDEPIKAHYLNQNVDLTKIPARLKSRMVSGITYYDAFNILTNAAKQAPELTLEDKIGISKWASPTRLLQLKNSDPQFSGRPHFNESLIQRLKGDI